MQQCGRAGRCSGEEGARGRCWGGLGRDGCSESPITKAEASPCVRVGQKAGGSARDRTTTWTVIGRKGLVEMEACPQLAPDE